jgi:hypothetical protein
MDLSIENFIFLKIDGVDGVLFGGDSNSNHNFSTIEDIQVTQLKILVFLFNHLHLYNINISL